ncbi:prepilin-type N-terminal cleavage/methylation domain-containing protein [Pelagicoccus sp. NFK12]|uniref:Prepilin-type N-terminal cleavage/methylation domain-containing protein n=1 Tax=Pelagicoccus enzymogenes TaxID=2773457 RepID=A0A927IFV2_9BACT|nr:prepilin-type N-terminal cleavage/methylation domain-containing protein [Pelagicoccus enzymogenes]MBD5778184.1 prepilin-type N-terminal cleavage/methylation domain-containing protein [Pelagicoccus enzymogenes]
MRQSTANSNVRRRGGFTLAELLISLGVFSIVMAIAMTFLVNGANFAAYNEGKLLINRDIRKFTSELSDHATYSNYFKIFKSFEDRTVVDEGGSGDFLVLAFVDPAAPSKFTQLIGYYRSATPTTEGPVQKFSLSFDPPSDEYLEDLLPDIDTAGSHPEVIELSKGLSDQRLFYNFFNRSITVQGEIIHEGSLKKQATNTYNFTVSPRG